jgi:hypothetical protein
MADNVVFITVLEETGVIDYKEYCLNTWRWWCERNGVRLFLFDRPVARTAVMKPTWQKYHAFRLLEEADIAYDQVALVDADTMVRWDCPDFFALTERMFSATVDHDSIGWLYETIRGYQHLFPETELPWLDYFNGGFLVINAAHKALFYEILKFYNENCRQLLFLEDKALIRGTDQTPVNFLVRRHGIDVNFLPKVFNLTQLRKRDVLDNGYFVEVGYVWHFNGIGYRTRREAMAACWDRIRAHYPTA